MSNSLVQAPRTRPLGVTILAVLNWIVAGFTVLGIVLLFAAIGIVSNHSGAVAEAATGYLYVSIAVLAVLAIIYLVLGWGLWTLKPWAFWATAVIHGLALAYNLIAGIAGHSNIGNLLLSIALNVIILVYLFADRNVRPAFHV